MRLNIYEALMQKAYLFGAPVLHSGEPIPREDVPLGWYCYDLRGTSRAPHSPYSMVDHADKFHTGSVLSLLPLKSERTQSRLVKDQFRLTQEFVSLKTFCAENNITAPEIPFRHQMRPASSAQASYLSPHRKRQGSLIPLRLLSTSNPLRWASMWFLFPVRIDFGRDGDEFWHTWWPRGPEGLNTPAFKEELGKVVDDLRRGVLKDFSTMLRLCHIDDGEIGGHTAARNYGFVLETERYRYCLRCNPVRGDYQAYLTCFDLRQQELNQVQEQDSGPVLGGMG